MSRVRFVVAVVASILGALAYQPIAGAQSSPSPYLSGYRYQAGGLLVGTITPAPSGQSNFPAMRNTYDSNQRLWKVETGVLASWQDDTVAPSAWSGFCVGKMIQYSYDANGREIMETVTGAANCIVDSSPTHVTQFSYDVFDRLTCTAFRMNPATFGSLPADACALSTPTGSYGPDRITKNIYDSLSRVTQIQSAVGTSVQASYATNTYTVDGLKQSVTDANGNETYLKYDGLDRLAYVYYPSPTSPGTYNTADYEQYGYDPNDNQTSVRRRNGQMITYVIDALNRVSQKTAPAGSSSVAYVYDLRGLRTSALFVGSGQGISNSYDGFGRMTSSTNSMSGAPRTIGHAYDADGDRIGVTHPDGTYFTLTYDGLDRFTGILESGSASVVSQNYYPNSLRSGQTRSGVSTGYSYDHAQRPQSWSDTFPVSGPNLTTTLAYNPADQITSRTRSNDAYAYSGYVNGNTTYSPNGLNQYASVAGSSFSYDLNGNLISDTHTNYSYDVENRLLTASGAYNATLTYDPLGRLFQIVSGSSTTQFLYDGDELIAEYNGLDSLLRRYVHGPEVDSAIIWYEGAAVSSATRRSLQADYQGSIESVADASGNPIIVNRYDEYGTPSAGNGGRFQYTGQAWLAEIGLYYYKARFYDPRQGRFLQTDPTGYQDDLNLYAYVGNDSVSAADPSGTDACPNNDKDCVQDPATEKPGQAPPGGHPVTEEEKHRDEVVVQAKKDRRIGDTPIDFEIPFPGEQYGAIEEVTVTAVRGKEERKYNCTDGSSGASNVLRPIDFLGTDAAIHTHPNWRGPSGKPESDPSPGPDDGAVSNVFGIPLYGISPTGVWVVENTPSGYRARLIKGSWGASKAHVQATVAGYNRGNGKGTSNKKCTFEK